MKPREDHSAPEREKRTDSWELLIDKILSIREQSLKKNELPPIPAREKVVTERKIISDGPGVRPLCDAELELMQSVFGSSLPPEKIFITNQLNERSEPFHSSLKNQKFLLHLGPEDFYYMATVSEVGRSAFIHQLVHVWQLLHAVAGEEAIAECYDSEAEDYPVGIRWSQYSREQQALLVEDWFNSGMLESDVLFSYIREHLRKGVN